MKAPVFPPRSDSPLARGQMLVLALLLVLTAGAWVLTIRQSATMTMPMAEIASSRMGEPVAPAMGKMAGDPWSGAGFAAFLVAWVVMMAAMMFPAVAPMLLLVHRFSTQRRTAGTGFIPTWVFAAGYLLVWTAAGTIVWLLSGLGSGLAAQLSDADRTIWAPRVLGVTLVVAGLYQLTPLKRACLDHCRSPLDFLITSWRDGTGGALRMGVGHGLFCLGCCWALFAVLVASGVMSLAWMLLLTLLVFVEKVLPFGPRAAIVTGFAFTTLGVLVTVT